MELTSPVPPEIRAAAHEAAAMPITDPRAFTASPRDLIDMALDVAEPLIRAAERKRLLAELDGQFTRPRGSDGSFASGWLTAISEFRAIITDPAHRLAPLAEMVQRMRAGKPAESPGEWWDDGAAAERERIRQLAITRNALYLASGVPDDGQPSGLMPFADLIGDSQ